MTSLRNVLLATLIAIVGATMTLAGASAADVILSGTIASAACMYFSRSIGEMLNTSPIVSNP